MKKIKRSHAIYIFILVIILFFTYTVYVWNIPIKGDLMKYSNEAINSNNLSFGALHLVINTFNVLLLILLIISLIYEGIAYGNKYRYDKSLLSWISYYNDVDVRDLGNSSNNVSFSRKWIKWMIVFITTIIVYSFIKSEYKNIKTLYNNSIVYQSEYNKTQQEKVGFYDKLWKTYLQKENIGKINRETFIEVTKIIMDNRSDGENITWKWVSENQNIPYSEFTSIYSDLSEFITTQRKEYYEIEKKSQYIAYKQNILLDTFPNNIYNKILKLQKIEFEYSILSDSTINVMNSKIENLK